MSQADFMDVEKLSRIFKLLALPARLQLLLTIGEGEACVCALQARLGWRRVYISQQLMFLRRGGLLTARRRGRFVFYRLRDPAWLRVIRQAAAVAGITLPARPDLQVPAENPALTATCSPVYPSSEATP